MSGAPQNINPAVANPVTTFGQTGGVFAFGLAPENEGATGAAVFTRYVSPFTAGTAGTLANPNYGGGPPAYPFFRDGTFPSGFTGYSQGFVEFNATPVAAYVRADRHDRNGERRNDDPHRDRNSVELDAAAGSAGSGLHARRSGRRHRNNYDCSRCAHS